MNKLLLMIAVMGMSMPVYSHAQSHDDIVKEAYAKTHTPTGREFRETNYGGDFQAMLEKDLEIAKAVMEVAPDRASSYEWLGRRYGYLGRLPEAIEVFSEGLKKFPENYKLYRYRGRHLARNYQWDQAISDYRKAAELLKEHDDSYEPNGIANALGLTISTFKQNIPYYMAQTSMAIGDYETVFAGMDEAINVPVKFAHMEQLVPVTLWKYMALRKMGKHAEAEAELKKVPDEYDLIENDQYHRAVNYLKGNYTRDEFLAIADVIGKYTVAMKDLFDGDVENAKKLFNETTDSGPRGFWPSEAELLMLEGK
ncbi:tetratricopeptide repeat protein [Pseudemcibacter aquimaris]|uniref:tetratricopeptide repeat protein n=1 Tax=Pseudemcibacter aquimaris TaxID=2857064 RepID=UPI002012B258|nr:tetratricopeptide repeat protein [Pseudemcibacter aquimaris]MCC3859638.1 tetratricopeptide repeat protein [Pseudemcibacter aquimaris]WDU60034.1 hypothetical protein KW060_07160 [Pseudemcibacter aquimaris]